MTFKKAKPRFLLLAAIFFSFATMLTSCEQELDGEFLEKQQIQLDRNQCSSLNPEDLDLSAGFTGVTYAGTSPDDQDFYVEEYDAQFDFPTSIGANDCRGICSLTMTFEPNNPNSTADFAGLVINQITLNYMLGSTPTSAVVTDYTWVYPNLEIFSAVTNTSSNYTIDFNSTIAADMHIENTTVGGLCVVENVDMADPPVVIQIHIPTKP